MSLIIFFISSIAFANSEKEEVSDFKGRSDISYEKTELEKQKNKAVDIHCYMLSCGTVCFGESLEGDIEETFDLLEYIFCEPVEEECDCPWNW